MVSCPFCGSPDTDRFELDGHRFLVFACMFTPEVEPKLPEAELESWLVARFADDRSGYFRRMCDRLHLYVADGPGAQHLKGAGPRTASTDR